MTEIFPAHPSEGWVIFTALLITATTIVSILNFSTVFHEIKTYPDAIFSSIRKGCLRQFGIFSVCTVLILFASLITDAQHRF